MDQIESNVQLPEGAHRLRDYARYYALKRDGRVWAVYSVPGAPPSGHEVCSEMNGAIPPDKWREVPCEPESAEQSYLPAGKRRWMSDEGLIPLTPDGGCEQITFTFDPRTNLSTTPSCEKPIA